MPTGYTPVNPRSGSDTHPRSARTILSSDIYQHSHRLVRSLFAYNCVMDTSSIVTAINCKLVRDDTFPQFGLTYRATITSNSPTADVRFTIETNPLDPASLIKFQQWERHGFTVIELPTDWRFGRYHSGGWQNLVIGLALKRIESLVNQHGEQVQMAGYSKELAREVLLYLDNIFPDTLTNMQLKQKLGVEPSDDVLLAALEALTKKGFIEGHERD